MDQLLHFIDFSISPAGLILQSLFIVMVTFTTLTLIHSARAQIEGRDLRRAISTFYIVIAMQTILVAVQILQINRIFLLHSHITHAVQAGFWSLSFLLVGWLWIKPNQQAQFSIFKNIFIFTTVGLFILEAFQVIEFIFSPTEISVPYALLWKILQLLICFFLFFSYFSHAGKFLWSSILFAVLHIVGLGINSLFSIPLLFTQNIAQAIAFLLTPQLFMALSFNSELLEKKAKSTPTLLSENMAVIPAPQVISSWLHAVLQNDRNILPYALCKALARTFVADGCLIVQASEAKQTIQILCGFTVDSRKQILPRTIPGDHEIVSQKKSVLFHEPDSFPLWIKDILSTIHFSKAQSVWYIPIQINQEKTFLFFISRDILWNQEHIVVGKKILPYLVQILQNYFSTDRLNLIPDDQVVTSTNPFLDLMNSEIDYGSEPQQIEEELKLALEEYNRIRKILEERGIGQSL